MRNIAAYCENSKHALALYRWFKTQDIRPGTTIYLVNVLPAFAYSDIGDGAASFHWGHSRLQELQQFPIRELAHDMRELGLSPQTQLLAGSRAAELAKFCESNAIDQIFLVQSTRFGLERFMTQQLIKKLRHKTEVTVTCVESCC